MVSGNFAYMPFRHTMEQGCRRQGCRWCKLTPKSFDLMEIWAKSVEIWGKSVKTFTKSLKIWENSLSIRAKMAPNVVWFEKNDAQHLQNYMKTFFWRLSQKRSLWENIRTKSGPEFFRASLAKFGQKSFAP